MKKNFTEIEIPFGVKDSELYQFTYTIPDGYSAEIKDGKVIVKKKESEDEKIINALIRHLIVAEKNTISINCVPISNIIAYLEKQKEQDVKVISWRKPDDCADIPEGHYVVIAYKSGVFGLGYIENGKVICAPGQKPSGILYIPNADESIIVERQLGCMKKEDVLNDMLKATTEEQKQRVLEIFDIQNETCCHFPCDTESEDYSEFDDRVYLDGDITFDKMAAVVDYLRACNPEKEVNGLKKGSNPRPQPKQEVVDRTVFDRIVDILRWCNLPIGCPVENFKESESEREHLLEIVQCVAHRYANSCTYCKEYSRGYQDGLAVHSWKPNEEQISALERAIIKMHTPADIGILAELMDNLKKL